MKLKGSLFWRLFSAIFAAIMVAVILFTGFFLNRERESEQLRHETEVITQARQVADYMHELNNLNVLWHDKTIRRLILQKMASINEEYNADIWIVSFESGRVQYIDSSWNTANELTSDAVLEQLRLIEEGNEIRKVGMFSELGNQIVTLGVPWMSGNHVVGAVLLHISNEQLNVSLWDVLPQVLIPTAAAILLGLLAALWVTRSQIRPIQEIDDVVHEFSTGDLSRRVDLHCGGELEQLGNSINRMAEELSGLEDSRRSFVSNVSHELRSPMTSIKGYIGAILDGTIPPDNQEKYLNVVMDETNRLTALVNDLLDLSRLESGKFPMEQLPFNANELMRRILIRFEQRINEKGIDVDISLADDPCFVLGDMGRIDQVVSNFVDNAVKFMTGDGSVLTLKTVEENGSIRFTVQDNGPGIDPKDLPHVLERFYKADKAHTAGMGTGLGLSICKNILFQHHSAVEIESVPGRTVFSFILPKTAVPARTPLPEGSNA